MTRRKHRCPAPPQQHLVPGVSWPYRMGFIIMAAREDASADQVTALRKRIEPLKQKYLDTRNEKPIMDAIYNILGRDWKPSERWAAKIAEES